MRLRRLLSRREVLSSSAFFTCVVMVRLTLVNLSSAFSGKASLMSVATSYLADLFDDILSRAGVLDR